MSPAEEIAEVRKLIGEVACKAAYGRSDYLLMQAVDRLANVCEALLVESIRAAVYSDRMDACDDCYASRADTPAKLPDYDPGPSIAAVAAKLKADFPDTPAIASVVPSSFADMPAITPRG